MKGGRWSGRFYFDSYGRKATEWLIKMKMIRRILTFLLIMTLLITTALGVDNTKKVDFDSSNGPPDGFNIFYPTTGSITGYYDSDSTVVSTKLKFTYTSAAVKNINNYNSDEKYTGMDIKDVGNSFHAYSVTSTAPNIKTDIETNSLHDYDNEAEIVILGKLSAGKSYSMSVSWYDYRTNGPNTPNRFAVNAELSNKPIAPGFDYNVVKDGYLTLASLYYGREAGYP